MRTTVTIDDKLYKRAMEMADPNTTTNAAELVREAIKTFVQVNAARRLSALGGTMPDFPDIPRRKPEDKE